MITIVIIFAVISVILAVTLGLVFGLRKSGTRPNPGTGPSPLNIKTCDPELPLNNYGCPIGQTCIPIDPSTPDKGMCLTPVKPNPPPTPGTGPKPSNIKTCDPELPLNNYGCPIGQTCIPIDPSNPDKGMCLTPVKPNPPPNPGTGPTPSNIKTCDPELPLNNYGCPIGQTCIPIDPSTPDKGMCLTPVKPNPPPSPPSPPSPPQSPIQSSDVLKYCSEKPTKQCYNYLSESGGANPLSQELNIPAFIDFAINDGYQCPSGRPGAGNGFYDVLYQEDGKFFPTKNGQPINDIFSCNMKNKECAYFSDRKPGQKIRGKYCPSYTSLTDSWQENSYCGGMAQSENDNCPSDQFSYKAPPVPGLKNICCFCGQGPWSQCN